MRRSLLVVALAGMAGGCGMLGLEDDEVMIRIRNASAVPFDSVYFESGPANLVLNSLPAGGVSAYFEVEDSYPYGYAMVITPSDTLVMQVIDYVGASFVEPGKYTLVLTVGSGAAGPTMTQDLQRDP